MTFSISTLRPVTVSLTRMAGMPYIITGNEIRNQYLLRVLNKRNTPQHFALTLSGDPKSLRWSGGEEVLEVAPLGEMMRTIVVEAARTEVHESFPVELKVQSLEHRTQIKKTVPFVGPGY